MKRKLVLMSIVVVMVVTLLSGCGLTSGKQIESGNITAENIAQVCDILNDVGLSNVDTFEKWVKNFASGESENASDTSGFNDEDCRMTAMLLAGDLIKYDSVEENYDGTYLMFDVDAIENDEEYSILKDKKQIFTTMFGEMPIPKSGFADSLKDIWSKHGISIDSDKCSIISILFKAYEQEDAFVGHTGILIDVRDQKEIESDYVFVEKIGFGEPFKITLIKDESDLIDMLSARPDYSVDEGEPSPIVYRNDEIIGEIQG